MSGNPTAVLLFFYAYAVYHLLPSCLQRKGVIHKRVETLVSTLLCACRVGKNRSPQRRKTIVYQKIIE